VTYNKNYGGRCLSVKNIRGKKRKEEERDIPKRKVR
jgi:hypothetical protein